MMSKTTRAGGWWHTQPKTRARMCMATNAKENTAAAAAVVVAHHSTAERGPSRPGYGGTAASTSCPYPTGLGGDWCRAFGRGGDIVVWGGWGVWRNENWLAACRNFNQRAPLAGFITPWVSRAHKKKNDTYVPKLFFRPSSGGGWVRRPLPPPPLHYAT